MKLAQLRAWKEGFGEWINCFAIYRGLDRKAFYAKPVEFDEVTPENDGSYREPTFRLDATTAQQLMDDLWQCGLRPSEGSGSAGALAATQRHLDDMRKIAFESLASTHTRSIVPTPSDYT